jgi:hypothetical protein
VALSRNCRADPALLPRPREFPRRIPWARQSIVFRAGFRSVRATSSKGAAAAGADFASVCDIWSFPMVAMSICRSNWRIDHARAAGDRAAEWQRENNCQHRNRLGCRGVGRSTPGGVPQPPTPHPSGDRPWPLGRRGLLLRRPCGKLRLGDGTCAPTRDCMVGALAYVGRRRRRVGGPVLRDETRRIFLITP